MHLPLIALRLTAYSKYPSWLSTGIGHTLKFFHFVSGVVGILQVYGLMG